MDTTTSVSTEKKSETEILNFLLDYALENDLPIACWRLPNTAIRYLIISENYSRLERTSPIEDLPSGFIFSPFDREKAGFLLPADFIFAFENDQLKTPETKAEISSQAWLTQKMKGYEGASSWVSPKTPAEGDEGPETAIDFIDLVRKSLVHVESNQAEKVVPSRTKRIDLPDDFHLVSAFQKLCKRYAGALISVVSIPGVGTWLGASPEALVSVEDRTIFKTVALAGTQPYQEGMDIKSIAWTQKEIEEQALVERYVISCFKKIRLREYEEHGPKTMVAGNVVHLKSDFTVNMKETNFPQLGSVMLELLHPTSAVCGMPLESSLQFLKENENYDREFYAGYLGPVNINNNINLFVNLRCMKLLDDAAVLYAGAGVTIDSIPEKEWEETEIKFNTLLNVIR